MSHRGQMLLIVLWVMGLVSVAIGTLAVRSTHELRLGQFPLAVVQRRAIAQAAVQQAVQIIQQDTQEHPEVDTLDEPWATGRDAEDRPLFEQIAVGDGAFFASMIDEERKMNLNTATVEQLARLAGLVTTDADAQQIASAIVDWRDEPVGEPCQAAEPPCHNGAFASVDELRLLSGMTPQLFEALAPYVTVYGSGVVNANTASAVVLTAMGYAGEDLVRDRATQSFDASHPPPFGLGVTSTAFLVPVEAKLERASGRTRLQAVIDRQGRILSWLPQR